ncbi:hypothetical protein HT031_000728 [Scenedesmus sp. PABB004]|nr:hypothetical protein HT031_000728 [Scenedesmus sp. PABB004]
MPVKNRCAAHRDQVARLLKQVEEQEAQLRRLEEERDSIAREHDLLQAYVDTMGWIRQQQQLAAAAESGDASGPLLLAAAQLGADGEELLLLEQLHAASLSGGPGAGATCQPTASERSSSDHHSAAAAPGREAAAAAAAHERIAPPHDPLHWVRELLSQPMPPEALTITLEQMQRRLAEVVKDIAVALHQLGEGPQGCADGAPVAASPAALARLVDRYMVLVAAIILANRSEVISALGCCNLETGELVEASQSRALFSWAAGRLGLSPDQVRDIVAGLEVFRRVSAPVMSKICLLFTEVGLPPPGAAGAGAGAGGEALLASSMLQHLGRVEVQAERLREMQLLLAKFGLLGGIAGAQLYGVLSYRQLARLQVLLHPHSSNASAFAAAVAEAYHAQRAAAPAPAPGPALKQEP